MAGSLKIRCDRLIIEIRVSFLVFCFISVLIPGWTAAQNRYDVLIMEFLPDPSPPIGLPESSFIELKNRSSRDYNLHDWKISNGNISAAIKTDYLLKADSFLILCSSSSVAAFDHFGPALGISGFPTLNNGSGDILLSSDAGVVVDALHYDKSWFENELKAAGGWSLEMIDPSNPCTGQGNWTASSSPTGGTPGKINSVDAENPDEQPPSLVRSFTVDSLDLILIFDEAVDSNSASSSNNYMISGDIGSAENAIAMAPFFDRVMIRLQNPMKAGKIYLVSVQGVRDCNGNEIGLINNCKAGIPEKVKSGELIFNEILFNPPPYGYDYLELFNRSKDIINCSGLFLAGRDITGKIKDPIALVKEARLFFPGEYLLLTENPEWIFKNYPMAPESRVLSIPALPSMPDDMGRLVLLNASGEVVDELNYDHHWHSSLLANESGVALERIRADLPTALASNWASAAATAGFGTPGYKNSESTSDSSYVGADFISVEPKVFSPDLDGYQDFLFINYHLPAAGFIGSILIYDVYGRMVRKLVNNILWGTSGSFRWEGLDDQQNLLPLGHYVIYAELFLPDGTVKKKKLVCALARGP
jgi:hypothetical protein